MDKIGCLGREYSKHLVMNEWMNEWSEVEFSYEEQDEDEDEEGEDIQFGSKNHPNCSLGRGA